MLFGQRIEHAYGAPRSARSKTSSFPRFHVTGTAPGVARGDRVLRGLPIVCKPSEACLQKTGPGSSRLSPTPSGGTLRSMSQFSISFGTRCCSNTPPPRADALRQEQSEFAGRFQQLTARSLQGDRGYGVLRLQPAPLSLNEVGGDPDRFGVSPEALHCATWPSANPIGLTRCRP